MPTTMATTTKDDYQRDKSLPDNQLSADAFLLEKVVLGDGYQMKPRWRRWGQN